MKRMVQISARRLKALESAENVARAFRAMVGTPQFRPEEIRHATDLAHDWLIYWLEIAPKATKYVMPPEVPKRWQYNREQAMLGWPDTRGAR